MRRRKIGVLRRVGRALAYGASIPERILRAASAAAGGASRLVTDTTLPRSFRRSNLFRFIAGNFQRFLIEEVGRVRGAYPSGKKLPKNFLARKSVGDVVEATAIVALAYSPLWFFALISGAASGTRTFLQRVVRELKKDGALAKEARIDSAEDLLTALQKASLASTVPFDQPPLSVRDLGDLRRRIGRDYKRLFRTSRKSIGGVETLWRRMNEARRERGVSFLKMSGAMALAGTKAAGRASGSLFREKVVRSYAASIDAVKKSGFGPFFATAARPYFSAMGGAFDPNAPTLTERLLKIKPRRGSRAASSATPTAPRS
jgi:hypothetical protein